MMDTHASIEKPQNSQEIASSNKQQLTLLQIKEMVNFYQLATFLGEDKVKEDYKYIVMKCPFHEGDRTPSFIWYKNNHSYNCYGCHKNGDIFTYIKDKLKISFGDSVEFILKYLNLDTDRESINYLNDDFSKYLNITTQFDKKKTEEFDLFTEDNIKEFISNRGDHFIDRGFTKETLDYFEVGFYEKESRVVVPIRDMDNKLIGLTGRTIDKNFKDKGIVKWKHYYKSNISESFFNINGAINYAKDLKRCIIVCEGPCDVMWLHQNGFKNVIGCLGNSISKVQKGLLLRNFQTIYLMLDGDSGGDLGVKRIMNVVGGYFSLWHVKLEKGKDPDNCDQSQLQEAIKNATKL